MRTASREPSIRRSGIGKSIGGLSDRPSLGLRAQWTTSGGFRLVGHIQQRRRDATELSTDAPMHRKLASAARTTTHRGRSQEFPFFAGLRTTNPPKTLRTYMISFPKPIATIIFFALAVMAVGSLGFVTAEEFRAEERYPVAIAHDAGLDLGGLPHRGVYTRIASSQPRLVSATRIDQCRLTRSCWSLCTNARPKAKCFSSSAAADEQRTKFSSGEGPLLAFFTYSELMKTTARRRFITVAVIATGLLISATACSAPAKTDLDELTACLDKVGVAYSVEDGTVVVTDLANDDSGVARDDARTCVTPEAQ
jgi:hypothetical protein